MPPPAVRAGEAVLIPTAAPPRSTKPVTVRKMLCFRFMVIPSRCLQMDHPKYCPTEDGVENGAQRVDWEGSWHSAA